MRNRLLIVFAAVAAGGILSGGCTSSSGRKPTATEVASPTSGPAATATRTPTPPPTATPTGSGAPCMNNLDLETGSTSPWSVASGGTGWIVTAATPATLPNSGGNLNAVFAGNYSLELYSGTGSTPNWTSTASNAITSWGGGTLTVMVAALLMNGHPGDSANGRFEVELVVNGSTVLQQLYLADDGALSAGLTGYTYYPWTAFTAGSAAPGANVVVNVRAGGCAYGGHTGYVYSDCQ